MKSFKLPEILNEIQYVVVDTIYMAAINIVAFVEDLFSHEEDE